MAMLFGIKMRRWVGWIMVLAVLVSVSFAVYSPAMEYWKKRNRPNFRMETVTKGDIEFAVNATGIINPIQSVHIGTFVSGPIEKSLVDFNDKVKKNDLLATIDPRIYDAAVARDQATLATQKAEVERAEALLQQARNNEARAIALRKESEDFLSDTEMDQFTFNRKSLEAQLAVAQASVDQAEANLRNSNANLAYTQIRSPVDGVVIDRKIDPGQTLAASFQTPELYIIAVDMEKEMYIHASVDEADIGYIQKAKDDKRTVQFTVDAYSDDLFEGTIYQVRLSSTTTQNVVTYPVIVSAPNPDLKLLPGMTANISFQVEERRGVMRIPNSALRYYPDVKLVHKEDRELLEGKNEKNDQQEEQMESITLSAKEKVDAAIKRNHRHVWVTDGEFLRAVEVVVGISDNHNTELLSGDLKVGQKLVTGIKPKLPE